MKRLTDRQLDVLVLVADGLDNSQIAARLFMSVRTVGYNQQAINRLLGATGRAHAVGIAYRAGLLPREERA